MVLLYLAASAKHFMVISELRKTPTEQDPQETAAERSQKKPLQRRYPVVYSNREIRQKNANEY